MAAASARHKAVHHLSRVGNDSHGWVESIANLTESTPATELMLADADATPDQVPLCWVACCAGVTAACLLRGGHSVPVAGSFLGRTRRWRPPHSRQPRRMPNLRRSWPTWLARWLTRCGLRAHSRCACCPRPTLASNDAQPQSQP